MAVTTPHYEDVIDAIRAWTPAQRLTLVQDVLATLAPAVAAAPRRQPTLTRALGLLATSNPPPSDAEVTSLLDQRRTERYT